MNRRRFDTAERERREVGGRLIPTHRRSSRRDLQLVRLMTRLMTQ